MSNKSTFRTASICVALGASALAMTACSNTSLQSFRSNPTTQLDARGETYDDVQNQIANTADTNFHGLNNDMGRLWMSDRPSRLVKGPKPY